MKASLSDIRQHEELFKQLFKPLVSYAYSFLRDVEEAEDVVQDVFANLWNKRKTLTTANKEAYLFTSVKNGCKNKVRHLKVVRRHEEFTLHQNNYAQDPYSVLQFNEISQAIENTLEGVPEKSRQIFIRNRIEKKKYKEIAEEMNISVKTVEAHMTKVLKTLRESLSRYSDWVALLIINLLVYV